MKLSHSMAMAGLVALSLAACKREQPQTEAAADPASAVEQLAQALRDNDLVRFNQISLPEDLREASRQQWEQARTQELETDPERDAQFRATMQMLTAPDAEQTLWVQVEPMLDRYDAEYRAQIPLMVAMGTAFANQAIQASETLSQEQKLHATEAMGAFAGWIGSAPLGDREKAREAISVVTGTARELDLQSMEDVQRLEQDQMLERAGIAWRGSKDVLALYGFDIDASLGSVDATVASETGDQAMVRVNYTLLGSQLAFDMPMVRIDGGWYSQDIIDSTRESLEAADEVVHDDTDFGDEDVIEDDHDDESGY